MKLTFLDLKAVGRVPNTNILEKFGAVTYFETTNPNQTWERIKDCEIVVTSKVILDEELITKATKLKLICVAATGTNNIDLDAAHRNNVLVRNVSDYSSNSVAQGTFSLLLHFLHSIPYFNGYVKSGEYSQSNLFTHLEKPIHELNNKRFGIIGLGNIGKKVANIAEAFGAEVVYYSTSGQNNQQPYKKVGLDELLKTSDVVSIHAPLNAYTANLISYERLQLMKKSSILLNTGRGGIIIESDLARAIDEDLIAGAGLDVFEKEPINENNPLLKVKNKDKVVLTPHITWASIEARTILMEKIAENIQEFLSKELTNNI